MKLLLTLAAALSTVVSASAAMATSYTGNWPFTVTDSKGFNGNHCLAVTDDGSFGWPHSGFGTLDGTYFTTFQVIGHTVQVAVQFPGGSGQNAGTVISAPARNGSFGSGVFTEIYGGESVDSGKLAFGTKGGC